MGVRDRKDNNKERERKVKKQEREREHVQLDSCIAIITSLNSIVSLVHTELMACSSLEGTVGFVIFIYLPITFLNSSKSPKIPISMVTTIFLSLFTLERVRKRYVMSLMNLNLNTHLITIHRIRLSLYNFFFFFYNKFFLSK